MYRISLTPPILFVLIMISTPAHAGIIAEAQSWVTGEVLALAASAGIALLSAIFGVMFRRITRTCREAGEFLTALGMALEDDRISRDELAHIIREGKDIFRVWI